VTTGTVQTSLYFSANFFDIERQRNTQIREQAVNESRHFSHTTVGAAHEALAAKKKDACRKMAGKPLGKETVRIPDRKCYCNIRKYLRGGWNCLSISSTGEHNYHAPAGQITGITLLVSYIRILNNFIWLNQNDEIQTHATEDDTIAQTEVMRTGCGGKTRGKETTRKTYV